MKKLGAILMVLLVAGAAAAGVFLGRDPQLQLEAQKYWSESVDTIQKIAMPTRGGQKAGDKDGPEFFDEDNEQSWFDGDEADQLLDPENDDEWSDEWSDDESWDDVEWSDDEEWADDDEWSDDEEWDDDELADDEEWYDDEMTSEDWEEIEWFDDEEESVSESVSESVTEAPFAEEEETEAVTEAVTEEETETAVIEYTVKGNNYRLRKTPSLDGEVIATLAKETRAEGTGKVSEDKKWIEIVTGDKEKKTGWISADGLEQVGK